MPNRHRADLLSVDRLRDHQSGLLVDDDRVDLTVGEVLGRQSTGGVAVYGEIGKAVVAEVLVTGCRLFDSEGVATKEMPIIENGVVKTYFLNTYISNKMGLEPTIEDATRVKVLPLGGCKTQEEVLAKVQDGILVTGFNGGNSNPATGNFSYGIEGFLIRGGKKVHPVREMLITGSFLDLWSKLLVAAEDARPCLSKLIPTLAFADIDFSA